jgi:hypothetical protein
LNKEINSEADKIKVHRGRYPTIFISFYKPHSKTNLRTDQIRDFILDIIAAVFLKFKYLLENMKNRIREKDDIEMKKLMNTLEPLNH